MKISIRKVFLTSIFISISIPWIISTGGSQGIYLYEILVIFSLCFIINKKIYSKAKNSFYRIKIFSNLETVCKLFILSVLIGLLLNLFQNILTLEHEMDILIKMYGHALITILVLSASFVAGLSLFNGKKDLNTVSKIIVFPILITAILNIIEWIKASGGVIGGGGITGRYNYEVTTAIGVGDTAQLFILGFLFAFFRFISVEGKRNKILNVIYLIIIGIAVLSIQSRAAYVVFFLQLIILLLLSRNVFKNKIKRSFKFILYAFSFLFLYIIVNTTISSGLIVSMTEQMLDLTSRESLNKLLVIIESFEIFANNPIFGVGLGQFALHSTAEMVVITNEFSTSYVTVASPHHGLAQLLSETGITGTILAFFISISILKYNYFIFKIQNDSRSKLFLGIILTISLTYISLQLISSSYLFPPAVQRNSIQLPFLYWFIVGYAFSFLKKINNSHK